MIPPQARLHFVMSSNVCSRGVKNHSGHPKTENCHTGYKWYSLRNTLTRTHARTHGGIFITTNARRIPSKHITIRPNIFPKRDILKPRSPPQNPGRMGREDGNTVQVPRTGINLGPLRGRGGGPFSVPRHLAECSLFWRFVYSVSFSWFVRIHFRYISSWIRGVHGHSEKFHGLSHPP